MPTSASWPLLPAPPPVVTVSAPVKTVLPSAGEKFLGFGIIRPLRRGQLDFEAAGGKEAVRAAVGQILGTMAASETHTGELPWRPDFGSLLHRLRHKNDFPARELAKVYVQDALRQEARARLKSIEVSRESADAGGRPNVLSIRLRYDIITANAPGNDVLVADVEQTVLV